MVGIIGLGLDLVEVSRIERAVNRWGQAFVDRIFTPTEVAEAVGGRRQRAQRLAARFAAKEAVFKALGRGRPAYGQPGLGWLEVGVVAGEAGEPKIVLTGRALARARELGVTRVLVSLTHLDDVAAAQAVAVQDSDKDKPGD